MVALQLAIGDRTEGPLILGATGLRLSRESAARTVARLARKAKIPPGKKITPHSLRHSAITAGLNAGVPTRDMQAFARHSSASTTARYDRARENLDRAPSYLVAHWVAGAI